MDSAPCKDCKERVVEPNCHMTCEKYLSWKAKDRIVRVKESKHNQMYWSDNYKLRK